MNKLFDHEAKLDTKKIEKRLLLTTPIRGLKLMYTQQKSDFYRNEKVGAGGKHPHGISVPVAP